MSKNEHNSPLGNFKSDYCSDIREIVDSHRDRCYRYEAKGAMLKSTYRVTKNLSKTLSRYLENSKRIRDIRSGAKQKVVYELDPGKIVYTSILQGFNLLFIAVSLIMGLWPLAITISPLILLLNYKLLMMDKSN